jgi:ABC-type transport system involved in multi-copper enzyme maturation permease subunit
MSAVTVERTRRPDSRVVVHPVTLRRTVTSEWIKFRSLRSSWFVLGGAVLGMLVISMVIAYNTRHITHNQDANDLVPSSPLQGYYLGQLLIGSLGVLFVSGEFSTGMIRSTFAAVPKRLPVLWAKFAVFFVVTAVAMIPTSIVAFLAAQAFIGHYRTGFSLSDPGVLRVVLGTGLYLTLVGVIGGMIGWIVRSTPGALVSYFALMLLFPVLFGNLLGSWGKHVSEILPVQAGSAFASSLPESPHLSPWAGFFVLLAWVVAGVIVAAVSLRHRDA